MHTAIINIIPTGLTINCKKANIEIIKISILLCFSFVTKYNIMVVNAVKIMSLYALLTYKEDPICLREFLGPRADSQDSKATMYKEISKQGYVYMKDLPNDISKKTTLNTVSTLLLGAGIDNDINLPDTTIQMINNLNK